MVAVVGNSVQMWLADPRHRIIEPEEELEETFQIIQPIHLIKKKQSYVMTALPTLTGISDWTTLGVLFSGELGNFSIMDSL